MAMGHLQRGRAASAASAESRLERPDRHVEFEAFVSPYLQRLYRFLVLRLGDERDARDSLQETLLTGLAVRYYKAVAS